MPIDPFLLLRAYAIGVFPMADDRESREIYWVEPKRRAIMPLDGFHLSRSLAKVIRSGCFDVRVNSDFEQTVRLCAQAAPDRPTTWINHEIETSYAMLHRYGFAHSVECWQEGELVGGLYGVTLGRAFFGESMFSRRPDASKVALAWLVARMRLSGCTLLDCQFMTAHLRSLGAVEVDRREYQSLLADALTGVSLADASALLAAGPGPEAEAAFTPELPPTSTVSGPSSGHFIAQLLTQTS